MEANMIFNEDDKIHSLISNNIYKMSDIKIFRLYDIIYLIFFNGEYNYIYSDQMKFYIDEIGNDEYISLRNTILNYGCHHIGRSNIILVNRNRLNVTYFGIYITIYSFGDNNYIIRCSDNKSWKVDQLYEVKECLQHIKNSYCE